jgi:hypothetical protein
MPCSSVSQPGFRRTSSGVPREIKEKNPGVTTTHCFLHREVLASKTIGEDLKQVLDVAVNMVSFIKQRPLKSRMFAKLSENMQNDQVTLL